MIDDARGVPVGPRDLRELAVGVEIPPIEGLANRVAGFGVANVGGVGFEGDKDCGGLAGERERRGVGFLEGEVGESVVAAPKLRVVRRAERSFADTPACFEEVGGRGFDRGFELILARGRKRPHRGGHAKY